MMVEQAGDCIGFLGFLLYIWPCLPGKKSAYLKKCSLISTISVRDTLKKGCKQCSPRSRCSFKSLIRSATDCFHKFASSSSSMRKRAYQLHNYNNDFAFATQISCESRGEREQLGPPLDFPGMRGTGGRDPLAWVLMILSFRTHKL